jgi:putative transposase
VLEALKAAEVDDKIRLAAETIYQALIEAELSSAIGAAPYQRTDARTAQRNGYRPRPIVAPFMAGRCRRLWGVGLRQ